MGYFANFIVYLMAMTGLIALSVVVFKSATAGKGKCSNRGGLKIIESMSLGARKTIYIIEAEGEKFLVAGDPDRTALISKLESGIKENKMSSNISANGLPAETHERKISYTDKTVCGITSVNRTPYESVMKSLAEKIRN